jgi:putative endonuclease
MTGASVYIVRCRDGHYYVGSTRGSVERRVGEHNDGIVDGYTKSRRPVVLVYAQWFERMLEAFAAERQLKGWSRTKKEALIAGRFDLLPELARNRQGGDPHASTSSA